MLEFLTSCRRRYQTLFTLFVQMDIETQQDKLMAMADSSKRQALGGSASDEQYGAFPIVLASLERENRALKRQSRINGNGKVRIMFRNERGQFTKNHMYEGDVKDGCFHGDGVYHSYEGNYTGKFKDGMKHGFGIMVYPDGRKYEGKY